MKGQLQVIVSFLVFSDLGNPNLLTYYFVLFSHSCLFPLFLSIFLYFLVIGI